jgi:hypothetical protein
MPCCFLRDNRLVGGAMLRHGLAMVLASLNRERSLKADEFGQRHWPAAGFVDGPLS